MQIDNGAVNGSDEASLRRSFVCKDGSGNEGLFSYQSKDESFRWIANVRSRPTGSRTRRLTRSTAARLRKDSATGPVVGRSFCEFMWAPFDSPLGKDIPYDPAITASPLPPSSGSIQGETHEQVRG